MDYVIAIVFTALGAISALPMARILNTMPAKCFCDYGEEPQKHHNPPRITGKQTAVCALLLAMMFSLLAVRFGLSVKTVALCLFCVVLVMVAVSDLKYCIIPDELIIAGCVCAVAAVFPDVLSGTGIMQCLSPVFGALIGGGIILIINLLGRLLYKKDALGMGDLKLMTVCGIACGAGGTLIALLAGILSAAVWFSVGILTKRARSDEFLPLGPFLVFGAAFTVCCQPLVERLLAWYVSLI